MLTNLHVKNLALIDEVEVEFGPGLNILTGETGAGKSILIGSINLALGKKMTKEMIREMIREGENQALVELIFQIDNKETLEILQKLEVEAENGQVIISRKLTENRSIMRLNGESCTASKVKAIASLLLDVHGQHEHQSLLYTDKQLAILDAYGKAEIASLLEKTEEAYASYRSVQKELDSFCMDEEDRAREKAFLEFEVQEIEDADLRAGEEEDLERNYRRMAHGKKIGETLHSVHQMTGYDAGAGDLLGRAVQEMSSVAPYDEELQSLYNSLADVDAILNDFNREAAAYLDNFSFSEEEFYQIEKRLDQIHHLQSKYGATEELILKNLKKKQERLSLLENFDTRKQELTALLEEKEQILVSFATALSEKRKEYAVQLSNSIIEELKDLNFLDVRFEIAFSKTDSFKKNGFDEIEFLISTNPGEPVRSLSKVVSGGELSRIMLALKAILADKDSTDTLIFDEIDTGISGRTAQKVSEKMAKIGKNRQVICITHLAQIAAMANSHFEIRKDVENQETVTRIYPLSEEEAVMELARILGGAEITDVVLENAREMKNLAKKIVYK